MCNSVPLEILIVLSQGFLDNLFHEVKYLAILTYFLSGVVILPKVNPNKQLRVN